MIAVAIVLFLRIVLHTCTCTIIIAIRKYFWHAALCHQKSAEFEGMNVNSSLFNLLLSHSRKFLLVKIEYVQFSWRTKSIFGLVKRKNSFRRNKWSEVIFLAKISDFFACQKLSVQLIKIRKILHALHNLKDNTCISFDMN